ncbi:hypothetical protein B0A78_03375 [Flavobacterium columnare NBRC 100251 = ATCC 23463]|nr:hypothetical protein B0A78_03375 [Flavobacterium columnare NBRC 100251 = ATCC 23463]QHJ72939.1 putative repressor [Flavobacterium phage fF4]
MYIFAVELLRKTKQLFSLNKIIMQQISPIKKRILEYIDFKGLSKYKFYQDTGITRGVLDKESGISEDNIAKFIAYDKAINLEWLLMGIGEVYQTKYKENLIELNDKINDKEIIKKPNMQKTSTNDEIIPAIKMTNSQKGIPLLPFDAFAGLGDSSVQGVDFDTIEDRYVVPLFDGITIDFMIPVRGSSMYPKYNSGDVVACRLVNELLFVQWNKVHVIDSVSQGVIMKRLLKSDKPDSVVCKSDNKDYGEFTVPMSDIRSIALVVGVIRLE